MAEDVIFVRRGEELVSLAVAPYEAEAVMQGLLEHYPQLLAGYEMSRRDPRRFLLVCREAPVADQYGAARWSLDHLFVDQDAIPTLVEVRRSSDSRIRHEVVGQMLDYAANGTRYWGEGALAQLFERTCADVGRDPAAVLEAVAGQDADAQDFWDRAERNLRGGVVRLVFRRRRDPRRAGYGHRVPEHQDARHRGVRRRGTPLRQRRSGRVLRAPPDRRHSRRPGREAKPDIAG